MKKIRLFVLSIVYISLILMTSFQEKEITFTKVPMVIDHNRMLVEAEFQRKDGSWRKAVLWVDSGNPDFLMSPSLARDLGLNIDTNQVKQNVETPSNVRIGGKDISFQGVKATVLLQNNWLFNTMHNDGNIPSTVLCKYHIIFDYPARLLTIADPGTIKPRGIRSPVSIHPITGIIQMEALISGDRYSFAFDNGASFSCMPEENILRFARLHPEWPFSKGAVGCANIWGNWPDEENWPIIRLPELEWGGVKFRDVAVAGLPSFFSGKLDVGTWYSKKTAQPVIGFLGPNIFNGCRIEIDYQNKVIYFEKGTGAILPDMDIVGLTLQPLNDKRYAVVSVVKINGKPVIEAIQPEDILLQVDDVVITGLTMGKAVDAMRGNPGDTKKLILERDGKEFSVGVKVIRFL